MNKNMRKGFTTVELVIVIAVIAILATALIPTFGGLIDSANDTKYMQEARQIYNDYLLEHATEATDATFYIKTSGETYYKVEDGKLITEPATGTISETENYIVSRNSDGTVSCNHKSATDATCGNCGEVASPLPNPQ